MKKHTIWNSAVFAEALRRTRISALILFVLVAFFVCIRPLTELSYQSYGMPNTLYTAADIAMPANFAAFFAPLFLLPLCFSHLNSKKATDFYHALPVSRSCYFITNLSAVMMWIIAIFTFSFALSFILYGYVFITHIVFSEFLNAYLACIAISLLSTSVYMVARSLSGTAFSNIVIMLAILFVPRAVIGIFSALVVNCTWMIEAEYIFPLLNPSYNLFLGSFWKAQILPEYIIYTFVLAVLYLVLAFFLYGIRKSETAENGTQNPFIRHIIAVAATFAVSIPILYNIVNFQGDSFVTMILVILCVAVFLTIEAALSKSLKKGLATLPRLGYVLALDLIIFGFVSLTSNIILNVEIEVEDVRGVSVKHIYCYDNSVKSYAELVQNSSFVTDQKLIEAAVNDYKNTVSIIKPLNGSLITSIGNTYRDDYYEFSFLLDNGSIVTRRLYTPPKRKIFIPKP